MATKVTSDEKESLLLKIPPTVSIEVVEDTSSEEEYDEDEENVQQNAAVLQLGSIGLPPTSDFIRAIHRLSVPNSHRSSEDSAGSVGSGKRGSFESQRLSIASNLSSRRQSSARTLSQNQQQNMRAIKQEQHRLRVVALMQRNSYLGEKRRFCECVTMVSGLSVFTAFTLYIIFAYGFTIFGTHHPFNVVKPSEPNSRIGVEGTENGTVEFICQTDSPWEWCKWIHLDTYCDFEWQGWYVGDTTNSGNPGVGRIACDFPPGKVELFGSYERHECGLRVHHLTLRDRGYWYCEMEKYYFGFDRRYGEITTSNVHVSVTAIRKEETKANKPTTSSFDDLDRSSFDPSSSGKSNSEKGRNSVSNIQRNVTDAEANENNEDLQATEISKEEDEYQRQFFLLKVFVLGGVGSVLTILAALFWAYFMYLWKTLDSSLKRDHVIGGGPGGGVDHAAMAVQEAANQAAYEKAALELAELGRTHLTTEMLADDMIQVLAGFNFEGGKLPSTFLSSPSTNGGDSSIIGKGVLEKSSSSDLPDRKRSVSFALTTNEEEIDKVGTGSVGIDSTSPKPVRPDGTTFTFTPADISQLAAGGTGIPLIFPGFPGVGNPALNPPIRRSRRSKKSNSGIPNVAALKRMARKFKQSAKSKIEEKAGLKDGAPSNLATHMASAFLTGNVNVPSNEPSPSLDPKLNSDNKQPSGDFIVQRKTSPAVPHHDKKDRHEDEGNILHKKHSEKEKKALSLLEVKSCKTKESVKSHTNSSDGMEVIKSTHKSTTKEKGSAQEEGLHQEKKKRDAQDESENLNDLTPSELIDEASFAPSEESHHGSDRLISPPASGLESKQRCVEGKPSMISKLLIEQTDSQQSLSTNSREFLDEETAV